ncbi:MAG: methyltransferase domain-containing protein [Phycisphaerae bacterium]|nr:methyltransferase domain-containing protein [Gemmatimonadaceae bacterium]
MHIRNLFVATLVACVAGLGACTPKIDAQRPSSAADTLNFPAPDRPVSRIVASRWTGEDERDRFGEAARVIAFAGVKAGMTVADIGAGDGYYVVRLAPIVGVNGKVIGEDIMPDYLDVLRKRIATEQLRNVEVVAGTPDDPMLAPQSVDIAFMIHMYHEITRPFELLWNLSRALKPSGTLAILDLDGPTDRHGTPPALLRCELGVIGYEQDKRTTLDDGAYVVLFRAPKEAVAPAEVRKRLVNGKCNQGR